MNNILRILLLALGGALIGAYAKQLNTSNGAAMFCLGILLAVSSMITLTEKGKKKPSTKQKNHPTKKSESK